MEPPNEIYDRTHHLFDEKGSEVDVSAISTAHGQDHRRSTMRASEVVHSVLLAEGIHYCVDPDELDELPRRFETGSSKATLTWFGELHFEATMNPDIPHEVLHEIPHTISKQERSAWQA